MTSITTAFPAEEAAEVRPVVDTDHLFRRVLRSGRVLLGGGILLVIMLVGFATLIVTTRPGTRWYFDDQRQDLSRHVPTAAAVSEWFGTDPLGRSMLARCLTAGGP